MRAMAASNTITGLICLLLPNRPFPSRLPWVARDSVWAQSPRSARTCSDRNAHLGNRCWRLAASVIVRLEGEGSMLLFGRRAFIGGLSGAALVGSVAALAQPGRRRFDLES